MGDKLYFSGSVYQEVPGSAPGAAEVINRADPACHLRTHYQGQTAIVTGGRLFVWEGKQPGYTPPRWQHEGVKIKP
jgi:hypothetical protein